MKCPKPFQLEASGSQGVYTLRFEPIDDWGGLFVVDGFSKAMRWPVLSIEQSEPDALILSGTTEGSAILWDDEYWYEVVIAPERANLSFWGDRVLIRTDEASAIGTIPATR
ncbi:hypothetical protein [Brevundimonas sp. SH203]|uniref:hypothetical protein n=1 Tax=Brevundimonas sp. SH203 TaxID=345167 RepID=UPI001177FD98|nr:hypothetical protein [Brevundimonas sp. SH203]